MLVGEVIAITLFLAAIFEVLFLSIVNYSNNTPYIHDFILYINNDAIACSFLKITKDLLFLFIAVAGLLLGYRYFKGRVDYDEYVHQRDQKYNILKSILDRLQNVQSAMNDYYVNANCETNSHSALSDETGRCIRDAYEDISAFIEAYKDSNFQFNDDDFTALFSPYSLLDKALNEGTQVNRTFLITYEERMRSSRATIILKLSSKNSAYRKSKP